MTPHEFQALLDKYCRGECTPEEETFITNWYNAIDTESRKALPEAFTIIIQAKAWARLKKRVGKSNDRPLFSTFFKIAATVSLMLLAGAAVFYASRYNGNAEEATRSIVTAPREWLVRGSDCETPCPIILADGTEVILQPGSEIFFPENFAGNKREVFLTGEAFFNVRRDTLRPFLVYANEVVTRVLGTSFTVTAYSGAKEITVAVKTGKVSVYKQQAGNTGDETDKEEVILAPNQQAIYSRSRHHVFKALVSNPHIVLDKPTLFAMEYDGMPVVKILQVLEENYGVDIVFDEQALEACTLTTSLADEGFYERIKIICEAIGAQYEIQETSVIIKSDGC